MEIEDGMEDRRTPRAVCVLFSAYGTARENFGENIKEDDKNAVKGEE